MGLRCALVIVLVAASLVGSVTHASAEAIERVVAVVNTKAIFLSQLRRRASPFLQAVAEATEDKDERRKQIEEIYTRLLDALVDEQLIQQAATKMNVTVSALEVDKAIDNVRMQNNLTREQFFEAVLQQGFTEKQYRSDVRKQLLRLKVINQRVRSRVNINDEAIKEAYEARVRTARRKQRFHASHVFVALAETANATEVAAAMNQAKGLRAKLSADNFEPTMETVGGGDLGWLDQGDLPERLESALLELESGQISQPVRGPAGVHIFWLRERQQGSDSLPSLEESKPAIQQQLTQEAMVRQEKVFLTSLRRKATIKLML